MLNTSSCIFVRDQLEFYSHWKAKIVTTKNLPNFKLKKERDKRIIGLDNDKNYSHTGRFGTQCFEKHSDETLHNKKTKL